MLNYEMMDAGNLLYQFGAAVAGFAAVVAIIFGVIECYFGYKLFKIIMAITGFFVGTGLGLMQGFVMLMQNGGSGGTVAVFALIGGIIGVLLAVKVYFLGVFLYGFSVGILIVILFDGPTAGGAVLGIITGVLLVIFSRLLIIISTAISGGASLGIGINMLLYSCGTSTGPAVTILLSLLFIATGLYYQFKVNGGFPKITSPAKKVEPLADMNRKRSEAHTTLKTAVHYCEECGAELENDGEFCSNCGNKVHRG